MQTIKTPAFETQRPANRAKSFADVGKERNYGLTRAGKGVKIGSVWAWCADVRA